MTDSYKYHSYDNDDDFGDNDDDDDDYDDNCHVDKNDDAILFQIVDSCPLCFVPR